MIRILAAAALALASVNAHAINKCKDAAGRISYTDKPCDSDVQARVSISDNTVHAAEPG